MAIKSYTVQPGDNLSTIAQNHDVTVSQILSFNSISDPDYLQIGNVLRIPGQVSNTQTTYVVQPGDNLSLIAQRYGTTVSELQSLNNIFNPDQLQIGQILTVAGDSNQDSNTSTYVVQSGDSLSVIAERFGTTISELQSLNNISNPDQLQIGQVLTVPGSSNQDSNVSTYIVQPGDSLSVIAQRFGTTVSELQSLNNISNTDYLQIGQVLTITGDSDQDSDTSTYVVQLGDSLSLIAQRYGTTVSELQSLNNISNPDFIQTGQIIRVSGTPDNGSTPNSTYIVQRGDTLSNIAYRYNTTVSELQSLNDISNPDFLQIGQVIRINGEASNIPEQTSQYTVQPGESLSVIAQRFGTTVSELQSLNDISNPDYLQVGQVLTVPGDIDEDYNDEDDSSDDDTNGDTSIYHVTENHLNQIGWSSEFITSDMLDDLNECLEEFDIMTKSRLCHFISQCSHESAVGRYREEIASGEAYEGREDIGNTEPGDGPKFKGGGYLQLTGRYNYTRFSEYIEDPEVVNQGVSYVAENYPWQSAGFWWIANEMNELADTNPTVEEVTFRVNGGYNGLEDRRQYYERCLEVFSDFGGNGDNSQSDGSASWLNQYTVTYESGTYDLPFNDGNHFGIDFDMPVGTEIRAITDGTVESATWDAQGGGNTITIVESEGNYYQFYMHLSQFAVSEGDTITAGDVIGLSGNTGNSTAPHLHFQRMQGEATNAAAENPRPFLENHGLEPL